MCHNNVGVKGRGIELKEPKLFLQSFRIVHDQALHIHSKYVEIISILLLFTNCLSYCLLFTSFTPSSVLCRWLKAPGDQQRLVRLADPTTHYPNQWSVQVRTSTGSRFLPGKPEQRRVPPRRTHGRRARALAPKRTLPFGILANGAASGRDHVARAAGTTRSEQMTGT